MGLGAITGETGSGHHQRRIEEGVGPASSDKLKGMNDSNELIGERRARIFEVFWKHVVKYPVERVKGFLHEKTNGNGKEEKEKKERIPALMETRAEGEMSPLEELLPNLPKGFYTAEELQSGLEALMRVLERKEDRMSQVNVISTKPEHFNRCIRILEEAKEKLSGYELHDAQVVRMMPSIAGVLIGKWDSEGRDTSHLPLFELEYDDDLAGLRRGYLLADPVRLIDCFEEQDRPAIRDNFLLKEREKRLQEVIALLVQRLGQVIDRTVHDHHWGGLEKEGLIKKEERVPIHPDIAAIFADQVPDLEAAIPYHEAIANHVTSQRARIRSWLTDENRPEEPRVNPLLEKLRKAKTPWQELLDEAYKMHTFGPSMLNVFNPETIILGLIEEFCIDHKHLNAKQLKQALKGKTLRSLLFQKGMARMQSSGWASETGILSQGGSVHAEAADLDSSERTILDEYMTAQRLPRSGVAFGIAQMMMWKKMDFSEMTVHELEERLSTLPMRSQTGQLEFGAADYLNLLRIRTVHALAREEGELVTTWDQYLGVIMEDPALAKLFSSSDNNTDLWEKNIDIIRQAYMRAYGHSRNKKEQAIGALMETVLAAPGDKRLSEEEKKMLLDISQSTARELMGMRSKQDRVDEQMALLAWEKRFDVVNKDTLLSYIEGPNAIIALKKAIDVLDEFIPQMANASTSMLRILLLWDERFFGGLGSAFSFTQDNPQTLKQLQMIEEKNGLIIPVQRDGGWVCVYPTKLPR